ncbi:phosphonate metabolism transcriptional regulator PhnF [Rhodobacterales bacterium HKCCE3408]|nr:phosphonate metabolism transcriptional regulator PhnF [Rhodobacterales bacterium HKCCE3408]
MAGPIWRTIAGTLRTEIAGGLYPPGGKLPSEAQLAARFAVNRHTVRHALKALAEEGLTFSRRGAGVFVAAPPPAEYAISGRVRFHRQIEAAGRLPSRKILMLETRAAAPDEAEMLALDPGAPVHVCEGLSFADDWPIAVFRSVYPAAPLPGLPDDLRETGSVTEAFARAGIADFHRASTRMTAREADATEARHLRLPERAPVLETVGLNVDPDGRRLEYGRSVFAGGRVTLTVGTV